LLDYTGLERLVQEQQKSSRH